MKTICIGDLEPGESKIIDVIEVNPMNLVTLIVKLKVSGPITYFRFRRWLGLKLVVLGTKIIGCKVDINIVID